VAKSKGKQVQVQVRERVKPPAAAASANSDSEDSLFEGFASAQDDEDDEESADEQKETERSKSRRRRRFKTVTVAVDVTITEVLSDFLSNDTLVAMFPAFTVIVALYLTWTLDSAECERGFSRFKLVKTAMRNRLENCRVNQLLMITINAGSMFKGTENAIEHFDFEQAVLYFCGIKKRRVEGGKQLHAKGAVVVRP
jgi:hypothetical protein